MLYFDMYAKVNSFRKNIQIRNDEFESVHLHLKFLFQMNVQATSHNMLWFNDIKARNARGSDNSLQD